MRTKHLACTLLLVASCALAEGCGYDLDDPEGTHITDARYRLPAVLDELMVFEFENYLLTEVSATSSGRTAGRRIVPLCIQAPPPAVPGGGGQ